MIVTLIRMKKSLGSSEQPNLTLCSTRTRTLSERDVTCSSRKRKPHAQSTWTRWDVRWPTCLRRCTRWAGSRGHGTRRRRTWWSGWSKRTWSAYSSQRRRWRRGGPGRRTRCSTPASTIWMISGDSRTYSLRGVINRMMIKRCTGRIISSKRIYKSMSKGAITTSLLSRVAKMGARNSTKMNRCAPETGRLNKRSSIRGDEVQFN